MRGAKADAMRGIAVKDSPLSSPKDPIVFNRQVSHFQAFITQGINTKLEMYRRREQPLQVNQFPGTTAIEPNSFKPPQMVNGGVSILPNAGIFKYSN